MFYTLLSLHFHIKVKQYLEQIQYQHTPSSLTQQTFNLSISLSHIFIFPVYFVFPFLLNSPMPYCLLNPPSDP